MGEDHVRGAPPRVKRLARYSQVERRHGVLDFMQEAGDHPWCLQGLLDQLSYRLAGANSQSTLLPAELDAWPPLAMFIHHGVPWGTTTVGKIAGTLVGQHRESRALEGIHPARVS